MTSLPRWGRMIESKAGDSSFKQQHQSQAADDFDGYISVIGGEDIDDENSLLELPVGSDGNLSIATLAHSFPDAVGLKFKNPANGVYRTLAVDEQKRCIIPPKNGWSNCRYIAIFPNTLENRKRTCSDDLCDIVGKKASSHNEHLNERLRVTVDLIVLNLSYTTDEEALTKFFEQYGEVQYAEVKRDYRTNVPKGYGFVKMRAIEAQEKLLNLREFLIDGRMSQVKLPNHSSNPPNDNDWAGVNDTSNGDSVKLYIGRVWNTLTEDDIREAFTEEAKKFSPSASIDRIYIPRPHRGFAFMTVNGMRVAKHLCKIRDFIVVGKSVCVSFPTPKSHLQNPRSDYTNALLRSTLHQFSTNPPKSARSTYSPPSYTTTYSSGHASYIERSLLRSPTLSPSLSGQMNYSRATSWN